MATTFHALVIIELSPLEAAPENVQVLLDRARDVVQVHAMGIVGTAELFEAHVRANPFGRASDVDRFLDRASLRGLGHSAHRTPAWKGPLDFDCRLESSHRSRQLLAHSRVQGLARRQSPAGALDLRR